MQFFAQQELEKLPKNIFKYLLTPSSIYSESGNIVQNISNFYTNKKFGKSFVIYIACTSGLHRFIAKEIEKNSNEKIFIANFDKKKSLIEKLINLPEKISLLFVCIFDGNSHAIIPHPFNPWFCLLVLFAKKHSAMDDGIALYYRSKVPNTVLGKIYRRMARNLIKPEFRVMPKTVSYAEFLSCCSLQTYFCLLPKSTKFHHPKTIHINPSLETTKYETEIGVKIFLDSSPDITNQVNSLKIIDYLYKISKNSKILIKCHPRHVSPIFNKIKNEPWVQIIDGDFEELLQTHRFSEIYSIYSSAFFTSRFLQPHVKLYCFTSKFLKNDLQDLHPIFEQINVQFIDFTSS